MLYPEPVFRLHVPAHAPAVFAACSICFLLTILDNSHVDLAAVMKLAQAASVATAGKIVSRGESCQRRLASLCWLLI